VSLKALLARALLFLFLAVLAFAMWIFVARDEQKQSLASFVAQYVPPLREVLKQKTPGNLSQELKNAGFRLGQAVLLRIYKQESELEVWLERDTQYVLFKTYPICKWSGQLGPKLKEGDGQSPEGFYVVTAKQLNPNSHYHLAMNIGFPNAFDQSLSRTGSALMIHGSCVSIGCYAMTDAGVEDIYVLVEKALSAVQTSVPVHIFPFRMTDENLAAHVSDPSAGFWKNLAEGDALFQSTKRAPQVWGCGGRYYFENAPQDCESVRGW
jgi:murein L,D-transpeptidase YafK